MGPFKEKDLKIIRGNRSVCSAHADPTYVFLALCLWYIFPFAGIFVSHCAWIPSFVFPDQTGCIWPAVLSQCPAPWYWGPFLHPFLFGYKQARKPWRYAGSKLGLTDQPTDIITRVEFTSLSLECQMTIKDFIQPGHGENAPLGRAMLVGWCRVNHSLWVKLLTRWRSRVWALSRNYNGDCDDQDEDYDDKEYDDDDDEENRSPPICGHPFFPAHPTPSRELVVLINLIQFPTKWVTSALPLLSPHHSDTISDVLPFSTRTCTSSTLRLFYPVW